MPSTRTYLFTDVEGSTRLWAECEPEMRRAMARHDEIAAEVLGRHDSTLHKKRGEGDSLFVTFNDPVSAVAGAVDLVKALESEPWALPRPIRIRAAIHTGTSEYRDDDYYGSDINLCARIRGLGHGGQILVSREFLEACGHPLPVLDLGLHRMKDIDGPRQIYQVLDPELQRDFPPLRGLAEVPKNLPAYATHFFSRTDLEFEFTASTPEHRLITLAGPAGCGKTRLAVEAAGRLCEGYPHGAWFVDCGSAHSRPDIELAIRSAINLPEIGDVRLVEQLRRHWTQEAVLIVFDNLEQCIDESALLIEELLIAVPSASIWTTSRETLGLVGEKVVRVEPLPTPTVHDQAAMVMGNVAVRMFFDRAGLVESDAAPDPVSLERVRSIVTELDGIPLAIELAAARLKTLDLAEIEDQLRNRMELLSRDRRTGISRQRTIENAIAWSFDLLSPQAQTDLMYLSVLPGPIDEPVARAVLAREDALTAVSSLAEASLLQAGGESKFRFLKTIREFANRQLDGVPSVQVPSARLCGHFEQWCPEIDARYERGEQAEALRDLAEHYDNAREAIHGAVSLPDRELDAACSMVRVLVRHWRAKGLFSEGMAVVEALNRQPSRTTSRGKSDIANAAGTISWRQGHLTAAEAWFGRALDLSIQRSDVAAEAQARNNLGLVAQDRADFATAENHHLEALRLRCELGLRDGQASSCNNLGLVAWQRGRLGAAADYFAQGLSIRRELPGKLGLANTLTNLALVQIDLGDYQSAEHSTDEAITIFQELGDLGALLQARFVKADAHYALGQIPVAQAEYRALLTEYEKLGDDWSVIACRLSLADASWKTDDRAAACALYVSVIEEAGRLAQWGHVAHACVPLARSSLEAGRTSDAQTYCALYDGIAHAENLHASWHCPVQRGELPEWPVAQESREALFAMAARIVQVSAGQPARD